MGEMQGTALLRVEASVALATGGFVAFVFSGDRPNVRASKVAHRETARATFATGR